LNFKDVILRSGKEEVYTTLACETTQQDGNIN